MSSKLSLLKSRITTPAPIENKLSLRECWKVIPAVAATSVNIGFGVPVIDEVEILDVGVDSLDNLSESCTENSLSALFIPPEFDTWLDTDIIGIIAKVRAITKITDRC